ncbi:MAG: hypothetical protein H6945_05355 [Zoogloeaceae bacterium]|nr:hypothetical protein [Zoogloeaceae bacterium]
MASIGDRDDLRRHHDGARPGRRDVPRRKRPCETKIEEVVIGAGITSSGRVGRASQESLFDEPPHTPAIVVADHSAGGQGCAPVVVIATSRDRCPTCGHPVPGKRRVGADR